jgi:myosin heavy subunit
VRFTELRDVDGTVLAQGLHPAIAVVAASGTARAAALSAVFSGGGSTIVSAADVEHQLSRATAIAQEQHAASVEQKQARVADAEQVLKTASDAARTAAHDSTVAGEDLARLDDLATRLSSAEETYEAAIRADAETTRALAAALYELDRILSQRHSAGTSLEQARNSRDSRGVPEAVIQQALNLQTALADAEKEKRDAVRQADEISLASRAASREAMEALDAAHNALRAGVALNNSSAPDWGPGLPLPGLVTNYRDQLAAAVSSAQAGETQAKNNERTAEANLEQERLDLDALVAAGPISADPQETIEAWAKSDYFTDDDAVVADEAFDSFGPKGAAALITALASRGCQVIYLTENADVLGWAIGLPHDSGGATTIPEARLRKPVLLGVPGTN